MPFYEYECSHCRYYAEVLQKISDTPLKKCPSCGRSTFKKLVSAPVFRLKGSGWYETDFKSDKEGRRNLAGPEKDDSSGGAEAKPAPGAAGPPAAEPKKAPAAGEAATPKPAQTRPAAKPAAKPAGKRRGTAGRGGRSAGAAGKSAAKKRRGSR